MPLKIPSKGYKTLESNYNINQLSLNIPTAYEPELNHLARDHFYSYHTINNVRRSQHAANLIKRCFVYFTMALTNHGLIQNDAVFIDGTKIKADANKYSFTWRRPVKKYHAKLREKATKLYDNLIESRVVQAIAPELAEAANGMGVMVEEIENEITKLDEQISQEPKVIKGGSVRNCVTS